MVRLLWGVSGASILIRGFQMLFLPHRFFVPSVCLVYLYHHGYDRSAILEVIRSIYEDLHRTCAAFTRSMGEQFIMVPEELRFCEFFESKNSVRSVFLNVYWTPFNRETYCLGHCNMESLSYIFLIPLMWLVHSSDMSYLLI